IEVGGRVALPHDHLAAIEGVPHEGTRERFPVGVRQRLEERYAGDELLAIQTLPPEPRVRLDGIGWFVPGKGSAKEQTLSVRHVTPRLPPEGVDFRPFRASGYGSGD